MLSEPTRDALTEAGGGAGLDRSKLSWAGVHERLMPDYNRSAALFWWLMLAAGCVVLGHAISHLAQQTTQVVLQVLGGVALAMFAGLFPVKIPRTNQAFSPGDVFIVLVMLMHGPAAGCLAAAAEALVSACRSSKRWTTRLGSASIASLTMALCANALFASLAWMPGDYGANLGARVPSLLLAATVFGMGYALFNVVLMSTVARLKRSQRLQASDLFSVFGWVGVASATSAAVAALLYVIQQTAGLGAALAAVPTIALLLTTLHFFGRQLDAQSAAQMAEAQTMQHRADLALSQARQREAELAAEHLRAMEMSEQRFNSAFTHASIGMALVSQDGRVQLANPALGALFGVESSALVGQAFSDFFVHDGQGPTCLRTLVHAGLEDTASRPFEVRCRTPHSAMEAWASISCALFSEPGATDPSFIVQVQDITAQRRAESELHHRAFHDKLTGLPNRDRFLESLSATIERSQNGAEPLFAVLFLDFDRFKLVNDTKGHSVGDQFLIQASNRLARCVRHGDVLARLGGDEFAILARGLLHDKDAIELAERLQQALQEPLQLGSMSVATSASIGITFSSTGYQRPEDMLRDADIAMYRAKQEGKARHALFDVTLHKELSSRVRLEADLRQALADGGLSAAYQPIVHLSSGKVIGFEALSRWNHPELGPISPGVFIPIAEDSALITALTDFMLNDACASLRGWLDEHPELETLQVHVNAAARDLADPDFVLRVRRALVTHRVKPAQLVIELTEGILMSQLTAAMGHLEALRELGVELSVDDFGTGYSSLSHLSRLPIDSLKLDMSFVRQLSQNSKEASVIRAIVLLGTSLGKTIVAEGVETATQAAMLRDIGCHHGQGYHLSRPLEASAVSAMLAKAQSTPVVPPRATPPQTSIRNAIGKAPVRTRIGPLLH